jgi:TRAP-type mannitol/chloroaromatic compound transport system permease large subunit
MLIFIPIVREFEYDLLWSGVLFALNTQVRSLSRPFGPAAFDAR